MATVTIGPDTMPPVTTSAVLTVAGNSTATAIGIVAPTDPNYAASQLSVPAIGLTCSDHFQPGWYDMNLRFARQAICDASSA